MSDPDLFCTKCSPGVKTLFGEIGLLIASSPQAMSYSTRGSHDSPGSAWMFSPIGAEW
jgi:hypothetical protein